MLGLFVGLAFEWLSLDAVRSAMTRDEGVRWARVNATLPRIAGIAVAVILVTGIYLGARIGVLAEAWMRASYAAMVVIAIIGGPASRRRMRALRRSGEDHGNRALEGLRAAASDAMLRLSVRVRVAFGLAIVYLMIRKPETGEAAIVFIISAIVAVGMALSTRHALSTPAPQDKAAAWLKTSL
ncbi:MAG TPA: hypothetical protein VKE96_14310 [Vicinamibacterales bacterium]|nr:hypothetical protein [Vicinamibacterales bacterium]